MTYPRPLRLVHWIVAALVTCQLALAVVLTQLRSLSYGQFVLSLHRQLGLAILLLVVARLVMSRWHKVPSYAAPDCQPGRSAPPRSFTAASSCYSGTAGHWHLVAWARGDTVGLLGLVQVSAPWRCPTLRAKG